MSGIYAYPMAGFVIVVAVVALVKIFFLWFVASDGQSGGPRVVAIVLAAIVVVAAALRLITLMPSSPLYHRPPGVADPNDYFSDRASGRIAEPPPAPPARNMFDLIGWPWILETALLALLGLVQVYQGLARAAGMWVGVGVLLIVLPFLHLAAQWKVYQAHTGPVYGAMWAPEEDSSPAGAAAGTSGRADALVPWGGNSPSSPSPTPRKRSLGRDGWVGKYNGDNGVGITLTISPAGSARQRDLAAPFAGMPKVSLVGGITVNNRSSHEVVVDTANAVLHMIDGTQTFAPDPLHGAAGSDQRLTAFRPPYRVSAGSKLSLGILFLPADTDLASLDHVRLTLDGKWADVR